MPRNRKERFGFNPWLNRERLRGTKQHKPLLAFRKPTLERIAENHDALIQETPMDIFDEQEEYVIRLSPLAYPLTQLFAEREIIAEQYTNWENAHIGGVLFPGDNDTVADSEMQEIAFELMNLVKLVRMDIGGGCVLDDGTAYPTALELITVSMAHSRGLVGIDPLAPDNWIFIIVHVLPSEALSDSNYGVDIIDEGDFHGKLDVFGGKVVRDVPKPDLSFTYLGNPAGDAVSDAVIDPTNGSYFHTTLALPIISGGGGGDPSYGVGYIPSNCCNGGAQPPATPPTPPSIPPTLPPIPAPNGTTSSDTICSEIFTQSGQGFDFWSDLASFSARIYGNRPANSTEYPLSLSTIIHNWITTFVTDFDFDCDTLLSIKFLLHMTHTDPRIFGVITNPFGSNNVTPRIDSFKPVSGGGINHEPIYYFQPDRSVTAFLGPVDIIVNRYTKSIYEASHKVTIRSEDRKDGSIGYEYWKFYVDESDVADAASVDPLSLQICGIDYKKHQYLFHFKFDGTDDIRVIGTQTYVYDVYGNARIAIGTGAFFTDGYHMFTDAFHSGHISIDMLCPISVDATTASMFGTISCIPTHNFDTRLGLRTQITGGSGVVQSTPSALPYTADHLAFAFTMTSTYNSGTQYEVQLETDQYPNNPDGEYVIQSLTGYIQ